MKKKTRGILTVVLIVLALVLLAVFLNQFMTTGKQTPDYYEFLSQLEAGEIKAVYFDGYYSVRVLTVEDFQKLNGNINAFPRRYSYEFVAPDRRAFDDAVREILANNPDLDVQIKYGNPNQTSFWDYLIPILGVVSLLVLGWLVIRQVGKTNNQSIAFGKSRARVNENVKVRFTDVAGAEEEKEELQEIIEFLKAPKKFAEMGARIPKGVLLVGPPGTGKTLFAKAVAGEAGVPFFSISGSDFVEMYVGVGASRVRDLFDQAKRNMPCIIFIDEIDAVGRQRGAGLGGGHDEREQTLNQLLVEMDGFEANTGIIIMAATNRADILDPALLRPGRFDRQIYVNKPDVRGREAILKVHARNKPIAPDVDFKIVARITAGFTGADLENLLNESAILAVRAGRNAITMADVNEGINKVVMGPQKKSRLVTEADKRITAYHESGHAILARSLKYCSPVHEVTIIPRGAAGGYTMTRPDNDNSYVSKAKLLDDITMSMGGRVAEELVIKNITWGAYQDIKSSTQTAHSMVTEYGMSDEIGPVYYGADHEVFVGRSYQEQNSFSEQTAGKIDAEVRRILNGCHERATQILTEKLQTLHNMARVLLEKETIHTEEVNMLMEGKSAEEVMDYIEEKQAKLDKAHRREDLFTPTEPSKPDASSDGSQPKEGPNA